MQCETLMPALVLAHRLDANKRECAQKVREGAMRFISPIKALV